MNEFEQLKELLLIKKQNSNDNDTLEKIRIVEEMLLDDKIFFKIDAETAFGVLGFLGVKENEILDFYFELVSPKNYKKQFPNQRISINQIKM